MGDSDQYNDENADSNEESKPKKSRDNRGSSAKAFYRAMYAGADPDPDDFGIKAPEPAPPPKTSGGGSGGGGGPCGSCSRLQSDLEDMERKATEAENLYKRMAADFENYRKRVGREREEFSAAGVQKAIEAILPALDDMDMAKTKLTKDMDSQAILDSLNMVYNRFNRCLEQIGIKQLDVIGKAFDPKYHEPVQQIFTNDVPDGHIVHQLRPGYMFGEKVLRPSLVNVATGHGADVDGETAQEEGQQYAENEEVTEESGAYEGSEEGGSAEGSYEGEDEENNTAMTQDLPVVDISMDLHAQPFDEEEQPSASGND